MIVLKDNERLFPATWEYNSCRILSALAEIVENAGGRVKYGHNAIISNRGIDSAIQDYKNKIQAVENYLEKHGKTDKQVKFIGELVDKIDSLERINNDPITVTHTTYISFVLDGMYYYYQTDSNPFFPFHYQKTKVKDGKRSADAYLIEDEKKEFLFDSFFQFGACREDVLEAANMIFNFLVKAPESGIFRDGRRVRVPNTYDNRYHYETLYKPERFVSVDF